MTAVERNLLVRRWPERRAVVLGFAAVAFAVVVGATRAARDPALAISLLNAIPVMLVALELGLRGGLAAAAAAVVAAVFANAGSDPAIEPLGIVTRSVALFAVGALAGWFSDRMRQAHERHRRLLDSGLAVAGAAAGDALPAVVAEAAVRTPGARGALVELEGRRPAEAGRTDGARARTRIVARGAELGRIEVAHTGRLTPEDAAALELLALQTGLAADNQRLLEQERAAAALEVELRRVRDDLVEQRSGLGELLEAQEEDRRRAAEKLHEDLAQVLAAVLLGLRMIRRNAPGDQAVPLDELYAQVVGVLGDVREVATSLRPSSLGQLGLAPALQALAETVRGDRGIDVDMELAGLPEPLPEPLRTGGYRIVEQALATCEAGVNVAVHPRAGRLEIVIAPESGNSEAVAAAVRARAALLGGTVDVRRANSRGSTAVVHLPFPTPA